MINYILVAETGHINFSPVGFKLAAQEFLRCYEAFKPESFSIVPFFLCCRAIELALKAAHLETQSQKQVKTVFGHNIWKSYNALPPSRQVLTQSEASVLEAASALYDNPNKAFEYVRVGDACGAYGDFPRIEDLAQVAQRIVTSSEA